MFKTLLGVFSLTLHFHVERHLFMKNSDNRLKDTVLENPLFWTISSPSSFWDYSFNSKLLRLVFYQFAVFILLLHCSKSN